MKNEKEFKQAIAETKTYKEFPKFKQDLVLKRPNLLKLYDKYQQGIRYGVDYLKQNPNLLENNVKLIADVLAIESKN